MNNKEAEALGYKPARGLESGELAGVMDMTFTCGLFVGLGDFFYRTRFCYRSRKEAEAALAVWTGQGNPPGNWIKEKGWNKELGRNVDRTNPNNE